MQTIDVNYPEPGFYWTRIVRGGPKVPVLIFIPCPIEMHPEFWNWLDRAWSKPVIWRNERRVSAQMVWPYCAQNWTTKTDYLRMLGRMADAEYLNIPEARPDQAVKISELSSPF